MIYPSLPAPLDLGHLRINGAGLGNCLFAYCRAVLLADRESRRVIAPSWRSLALNAKLRGDGGIRHYHTMLRPHADELAGVAKAAALAALLPRAEHRMARADSSPPATSRPLIVLRSDDFSFTDLRPHRARLRRRLVEIMRRPPLQALDWGAGQYVAVHVRLGDFEPSSTGRPDERHAANTRLPLAWYLAVIRRLHALRPQLPVRIFSDGSDAELRPLLALSHASRGHSSDDVNELLAMAGATLLVGSHSTFSRWAVFLGNMPAIWHAPSAQRDSPADAAVPVYHIADAATLTDLAA
ncbi:MAG: hypothetical protein WC729_01850 [Sphingomonas sp.]|jgi:hypothetical protein|uniref:hypothetical protein n=1 Tax=Sphingomonas sp. TaxID=28214 RepID=UPI0035668405